MNTPYLGAIIVAGGRGLRMGGGVPKQFRILAERPIWRWALDGLMASAHFDEVVFVVPPEILEDVRQSGRPGSIPDQSEWKVVSGGARRQDSVEAGLNALSGNCEIVAVHDAARPFPPRSLARYIELAVGGIAALPGVPMADSLRRIHADGFIQDTISRDSLWAVQTPQVCRTADLTRALRLAVEKGRFVTDEAEALLAISVPVKVLPDSPSNFKLTEPADWQRAEALVGVLQTVETDPGKEQYMRIGTGHDVHRLVEERPLILGAVDIPHSHGLAGHSDADAVLHALTDALLNACSLGDIGRHFPDTDERWKNADSRLFVKKAVELLDERGWRVVNASIIILAEAPKLSPHIPAMTANLASLLRVTQQDVGISVGTMEAMGPVGQRQAIEVHATVLVGRNLAV